MYCSIQVCLLLAAEYARLLGNDGCCFYISDGMLLADTYYHLHRPLYLCLGVHPWPTVLRFISWAPFFPLSTLYLERP